jgi:hypothetical protein
MAYFAVPIFGIQEACKADPGLKYKLRRRVTNTWDKWI